MKANILICARPECLGETLDLPRLKQYFVNNGHEVLIHDNFCAEISNLKLTASFKDPGRPVVFAGCSPLGMENRIKMLFPAPLEVANIREQCAWTWLDAETVNRRCREIIRSAARQVAYTPAFKAPPNILKEQLAAYEAELEKIGPNPFKA